MTELLEKALAKVSELSAEEQDAIAALVLETLKDEQQWEAASQKVQEDIYAG